MPAPCCETEPVPLIAFATVSALLRLKMSAPLSVTAPAPSVPVVLPEPICSVPALTVVVPAYVLLPVRIVVPAAFWMNAPEPLITPEAVCVPAARIPRTVPLFVTLFAKVPAGARFRSRNAPAFTVVEIEFAIELAVPPSPIASVPWLTSVAPLYVCTPRSRVVPAPLCVSASVPLAFERMPESVSAVAEFTFTRPAPPSVLPMLFANGLAVRFTSVSTPPVPTLTDAAPVASIRLANPAVPMIRLPALTVTPLRVFPAFVSVVLPAPVCVRFSVFPPLVSAPASVLLFAEFAFTVPVPPKRLLMLLFSVPPLMFTSERMPALPTLIALAATFKPGRDGFPTVPIWSVPTVTFVLPK